MLRSELDAPTAPRLVTVMVSGPSNPLAESTEYSRNDVVPLDAAVGMSIYGYCGFNVAFDGLKGGGLLLLKRQALPGLLVVR